MSEDAELLPGAVGPVVVRGDHVEGELPFSSARVFSRPPRHEGPEVRGGERLVRGHGRVLEVSIVKRQEVELEVLAGRVPYPLPGDHHAQAQVPRGERELGLEGF